MRQWMLRITAYAERLLADLDTIDWTDSLKEMQRNWIGRSEGAEVDFQIAGSPEKIRVFTTRPDTLFGATYMVLSPEHKLVAANHHASTDASGRRVQSRCHRQVRFGTHGTGQGKDRRLHRRLRHQSRQPAKKFRFGSRITSSPATAPARSWLCPRTIRAISSSPPNLICRSSKSLNRRRAKTGLVLRTMALR